MSKSKTTDDATVLNATCRWGRVARRQTDTHGSQFIEWAFGGGIHAGPSFSRPDMHG